MNLSDKPLRDHGSFSYVPSEDDIHGHHREKWQDQAMYIGLHPSKGRKHRHHKKHSTKQIASDHVELPKPATPPSQRVQFLLGRDVDDDCEDHLTHEIFCEMEELRIDANGEMEWMETARWIKFEEDVDEGGERWSKPHVAALSLHSLFEARRCLMTGTILLDMDASNLHQITDLILDQSVANNLLDINLKDNVARAILSKHKHLHQRRDGKGGLQSIRSLADIGRRASEKKIENKFGDTQSQGNIISGLGISGVSKPSSKDLTESSRNQSMADVLDGSSALNRYNENFLKKIPAGAEAASIMVGECEFLSKPIVAFVRLLKSIHLQDLVEVPIPTKFIFIYLGPIGNQNKYREIGRSISTLMSDEIFHEVAYLARDRNDMLSAVDEFMDCVTVLPPAEWDPTIRIEPPKSVPSQEKRKKAPDLPNDIPINGQIISISELIHEDHQDPTLLRTGRFCGGLILDIKRKLPFYLSDFKDALHVQCVASFFFMYFACLSPIITFGGLLGAATGDNIAAMESLVSGALCGITYHFFAGQPLTIIGSTGPVLVFESIVYRFCSDNDLIYLTFRFWIGMWMCLFLLIMVVFDLSALVRFITRFTEECFAMLIAVIFIYEAFKKLIHILDIAPVNRNPDKNRICTCDINNGTEINQSMIIDYSLPNETLFKDWNNLNENECKKLGGKMNSEDCIPYVADVFFFSCLLFICTFFMAMGLKEMRNKRFFPNFVRVMISDFAVLTSIFTMVLIDFLVGLNTPKLRVPPEFRPTLPGRGWIVNPFLNPWYWSFAGIFPAMLATILIFMDQQITTVIVNRKENKLLKGNGYHLDLLVITLQILICSLIGTPWFVAATVLSINHIRSLTRESESSAPGERPKFLGVREQRVTGILVFIMVGLSAFMANVLKFIPMAVLYGVFLYMGVSSLKGIQFVQRIMILFMPSKYQPDYMFLRFVPIRRVHLFTLIQILCFSGLWVIKQIKQISIVFPLMVLAMCFIRKSLDYVFTQHELKWLDDIMPDIHKKEKADKMNNKEDLELDTYSNLLSHPMNISDEVSKSGLWKSVSSEYPNKITSKTSTEFVTNKNQSAKLNSKEEARVQFNLMA